MLFASTAFAAAAAGETRIVRQSERAGEARYEIEWTRTASQSPTPEPLDHWKALESIVDRIVSQPPPDAAAPRAEAFLLALPAGLSAGDARISLAWEQTTAALPTLSAEPVRIGPLNALHVRIGGDGTADRGRISLRIDGPRRAGNAAAGIHLSENQRRILRALVKNPGAVEGALHRPEPSRTVAIPTAPAPQRLRFTGADDVRRVALADLPNAGAGVRLDWHGAALPYEDRGADRWFFSPRRNTLTDRSDSIFPVPNAAQPSDPITTRTAFLTLAPAAAEVAQNRSLTNAANSSYQGSSFQPIGERFVITRLNNGQARTVRVTIPDQRTSSALRVEVLGLGLNESVAEPDHFTTVTLSGRSGIAEGIWEGRTSHTIVLNQPADVATPPPGTHVDVLYTVPTTPGVPADIHLIESATVFWNGYPRLDTTGRATLSLPADPGGLPRRATIGGFPAGTTPSDVLLLDITNPTAPLRIVDPPVFAHAGGIAVEFETPGTTTTLFAMRFASLPAPLVPEPVPALPELPTTSTLTAMFVRAPELASSLSPLVALHGDGAIELDPAAAYCAFNGGQESPEAIRQALAAILAAAPARVAFPAVVLAGHATLDPRNYLAPVTVPQVPVFVEESVDSGFTIENPIDFPYARLEGSDGFADAQVSRLPAKSSAELDTMIARILAHGVLAQDFDNLRRPGLFVSDDDPATLLDASLWPAYWESTGRSAINVLTDESSDGSAERAAILDAFATEPGGVAFALYGGHGSNTVWGDEQLLTATTIPNALTANKWPTVATFTCLNAFFASPTASTRCMAEAWMLAGANGAVATICPVSVDFYVFQRAVAIEAMEQIVAAADDRPFTVGDLWLATLNGFEGDYPEFSKTKHLYVLFGYPLSPLTVFDPPTQAPRWQHYE